MVSVLIEQNPGLKAPALCVLDAAERMGDVLRAQLEDACAAQWQPQWRLSVAAIVDVLVRNGLLAQRVLVDGEPYEGTLEDVQRDEEVPEDAQAECRVSPTAAGAQLRAAYEPSRTLARLLAEKPAYQDVFAAALAACNEKGGATREQLEEAVNRFPQLAPDPATGRTRVYPQYFIDALETAGGIRWDGAWNLTEAGRKALAE